MYVPEPTAVSREDGEALAGRSEGWPGRSQVVDRSVVVAPMRRTTTMTSPKRTMS